VGDRGNTVRELKSIAMKAQSLAMALRRPAVLVVDPDVRVAAALITKAAALLYDCGVAVELGRIAIAFDASRAAEAGADPYPLLVTRDEADDAGSETAPDGAPAPPPGQMEAKPTSLVRISRGPRDPDREMEEAKERVLSEPVGESGFAVVTPRMVDPRVCPTWTAPERALMFALERAKGSVARWSERRKRGASDADLRSAIAMELGNRHTEPDHDYCPGWTARGGPDPAIFIGQWKSGKLADLKGDAIVAAARKVMGIPYPTEAVKPKRARAKAKLEGMQECT